MDFYGVEQVYSESGVDLTLLRANLDRPVADRILRNEMAVRSIAGMTRFGKNKSPMNALDIERILRILTEGKVDFILVGGLALRAHGSAHLTEDAGFCYRRTPDNIGALAAAVAGLHPYLRGAPPGLPFRFDVPTITAGLNFTLTTDAGDIDFLGELRGIGIFEEVDALAEEMELFGRSIRVLSIDGLMLAKKAAGRAKDHSHLLELEELRKLRDRPQADG